MRSSVFGRARQAVAALALLAAYAVMVAGVLAGWAGWFFVAAAVSYLAEAALIGSRVSTALRRWSAGLTFRFMVRELLLVAIFVAHAQPSVPAVVLLLVGLAGVHATRLCYLYLFMRARRTRRGLIRWANLDVDGERSSPMPLVLVGSSWPPVRGVRLPLQFDLFLFAAAALAWRRPDWPLAAAVVLIAAGGAALVWAGLTQYRRERALPSVAERNDRLYTLLAEREPQVAIYFSSAIASTYALNVWLETIDRLSRSTVIFLRELGHLANLGPTDTPIVVLPTAPSVERFRLPTMRVALYPTTVIKNNHMLRLTGIRHIFINHGDGDKSVTYSPLHRAFDEVWVAGQAARDRYLNNHVGVRDEQIHLVGRPQLAHIERAVDRPAGAGPVGSSGSFTVLYAPTWEGNFDGVDYSSVALMGEAIVRALLASALPLTVLFKPHPATGQRSVAARTARARLEQLVVDAGAPHRVVELGPEALYEAFNASDLMIADVSSVVADYLASRKPYIVTNPKGLDPEQTRIDLPSTSGGHLLGPDLDGFAAMLADALGPDSLRARRRELATYFLGAEVEDPIQHFVDLTATAVDQESARLPAGPVAFAAADDLGPDDLGPDDLGPDDVGPDDLEPDDLGPDGLGPDGLGPDDVGPEDLGPDVVGPEGLGSDVIEPEDIGPDAVGPDEIGPDVAAVVS